MFPAVVGTLVWAAEAALAVATVRPAKLEKNLVSALVKALLSTIIFVPQSLFRAAEHALFAVASGELKS